MNRSKELIFKKKWLQWVLDFIQTDLNSLSGIKKRMVAIELTYICSKWFFKWSFEEFELFNATARLEEWLIEKKEGLQAMFEIQGIFKSFLETIKGLPTSEHPLYQLPEKISYFSVRSSEPEPAFSDLNKPFFFIQSAPKKGTLENWGITNISELIYGLRFKLIIKCKGCSRYFLNFTEREKLYCTTSCASRSIAKVKRDELKEKHPKKYKAYLKKQQKYSRQYYRKKLKELLGPNVKPKRIRRKRKEA
jgi:hypothetical protein